MMRKKLTSKQVENKISLVIDEITKISDRKTKDISNLSRIGVALSSETNLDKLFELILDEAVAYTNADAATIYKVSDNEKFLDFVLVYNKSLNIRMGINNKPIIWKSIPLYDRFGKSILKYIVTTVYHKKRLLCFDDVYKTTKYDITGTKEIDVANQYRSKSMLALPLKNHENEVLGVLQIINPLDLNGKVTIFNNEHKEMLKSLASMAAIAMSNRKLINDLESLLMQFMQSIAKAVERKSKYSSTHITKVALIADLIAQKINETSSGKFARLHLKPYEIKELSMAGLMHDIGKIVTPEHIMDKSTKLEKVTDRLGIIKLRVDLLKCHIQLLVSEIGVNKVIKQIIGWHTGVKFNSLAEILEFLDGIYTFLEKVNQGAEFLEDNDISRIQAISNMKIYLNKRRFIIITEDDAYNLSIRKGTLTNEEKKTMDDHVVVTWEMLSNLTFPKKYSNVAIYAATHHEKLNGTGYPFGLKAKDLKIQSRILALADIFEAVTSVDRPYAKPQKLSSALKILAVYAKNGEIDKNLLDLFLDSELYYEYARKYMDPIQIDEPDLFKLKMIYS